ncbi:MAG: DUF4159 domain-containing protein [Alphaproteobacteria bacterium]|nr:DUF4159 domain-containing protein [Alphaproteobacteria bacterium]
MGAFSTFAFLTPWWLVALASLPVLWWLLRVTPPAPRRTTFPALALLARLKPAEETPAQTPWWLLLLRLFIAFLVIVALAQPIANPAARLAGSGPVMLVVDDGWAAASDWRARRTAMEQFIDRAERDVRPVIVLPTAPGLSAEPPRPSKLMTAGEARTFVGALEPKPWASDRQAALATLEAVAPEHAAAILYAGDGLEDPHLAPFVQRLQRIGPVTYLTDPEESRARLVLQPVSEAAAIAVTVARPATATVQDATLVARGEDGRPLAREGLRFEQGASTATARVTLPSELRNRVARIEIEGEASVGGVALVDERWRRRPVGIVSGATLERNNQPLLADTFYLERALQPFAEVRTGEVPQLLQREMAVMILADIGRLADGERTALEDWMKRGGVVIRFAGPRLAEANDDFVPAPLRQGGRAFGGAMSWDQPLGLAPFDANSAFAGLEVPADVRVRRQVLAEPTLELSQKTWARLSDGTPLVTADKRGEGWLVLVHVTASPEWSDLPISGLYLEMLRRLVGLSQGIAGDAGGDAVLPPVATLDAFGRLVPPFPAATGVVARAFSSQPVGPRSPPGHYGSDVARRALNLAQSVEPPKALTSLPSGVESATFARPREVDFKPALFVLALILLLVDLLAALVLRGLVRVPRIGTAAALAAAMLLAPEARAQTPKPVDEAVAIANTTHTRFGYVLSGNAEIDEISRAGLTGLGVILARRTAVDPVEPAAVDVERDEMSFFPLLYWPVAPAGRLPGAAAMARVKQYLTDGGMILFDTREAGSIGPAGVGPAALRLREILRPLDLPRLARVPAEHVLTKTFYLLQDFPGRLAGAPLWIEQPDAHDNDGVTTVLIGANDFASAWALDANGRAMFAVVPGGEGQRELAVRFGVNLVMYALTGNYKGDQVHVDAILERIRR